MKVIYTGKHGYSDRLCLGRGVYKFKVGEIYDLNSIKKFYDKFEDRFELIQEEKSIENVKPDILDEDEKINVDIVVEKPIEYINLEINQDENGVTVTEVKDNDDINTNEDDNVFYNDYIKLETREEKKSFLSDLHWQHLKDIAEILNIEYTNKKKTIKKILNI